MKTLYLMRHARPSPRGPGLEDFDRPLSSRGREEAPRVGEFIREENLRVDLMISSPAARARETAALVRESARLSADLLFDERIYEADAARLLEVVTQAADSAGALLLVGHNPGLEELLTLLTGERRSMTTAALARVALDVDEWAEVRGRAGRLERFVRPDELA
jgi:phosphohistidine phosphatase